MRQAVYGFGLSILVSALSVALGAGCSDDASSTSASSTSTSTGTGGSGTGGTGGAAATSTCTDLLDTITERYTDATDLKSCDGVEGAQEIVGALMNFDGITIDNNGTEMTPCIESKCDDKYVYIASNSLPHYDFVQTTPNTLKEAPLLVRVPMVPTPIDPKSVKADNASAILGCIDGYNQYVDDPSKATSREPSHFCTAASSDTSYFFDELANGESAYYRKIPCMGTAGILIAGSPIFSPNEAAMPDAFGNPLFYTADTAGEPIEGAAALDLCGGHTSPNTMHYHGINEACFEVDEKGAPKNSYVTATEGWDFEKSLTEKCTEESDIVGVNLDGYVIKGSCVCTKRDAGGTCTEVKRARSSWAYGGLSDWGTKSGADPDTENRLSVEGMECTQDDECCTGASCDFQCSYSVFDDPSASGGSAVGKRCVLLNYSWCTHQFIDRTKEDVSKADFVYLDRCNGYEGPDGYAYYATMSFPYVPACYKDTP